MQTYMSTILHNLKKICWLLFLPILATVLFTSCGDTPVDSQTTNNTSFTDSSDVNTSIKFVPEQFDAVGSIQGTVIDKATGESLSDIPVSLLFNPPEADEASVLTDTTGEKGTFAFAGVPVNSEADMDQNNSPYMLEINTEGMDNYRNLFRFRAPLTFESTGGDGAATNLVSNVTVPLRERAASVKGKLHTYGGTVLAGTKVYLYQWFNPVINGGSGTQTEMMVDSTTTESDGSFMFENVEEDVRIWFEAVDESNPSEVVRYTSSSMQTKSASGDASATIDYGVVNVGTQNETGAFYVEEVTPAPDSDMSTDTMFIYTFNRPLAENQYIRTDLGFGNGTFKDDIRFYDTGSKGKANGDVDFSVKLSSNRDSLMIMPLDGQLEDAHRYILDVSAAFNNPDFVDEYDNSLSYNSNTTYSNDFEVESLRFSTNDNNAKPHTPTLVASDAGNVDYNDGSLNVSWEVDESSAPVLRYEIWEKVGDEPYERVNTFDRDGASFNEFNDIGYYVSSYNEPLVILRGFNNDVPEEAITKSIKIRAISENLREGDFSNEIVVGDSTKPDVISASYSGGDQLTVEFEEPLQKSLAETASNYSFEDAGGNSMSITIEEITYAADYGTNPSNESYTVTITVANGGNLNNGQTVIVDPSVTDLAGNGMDTNDSNNDNDGYENEATY